MKIFEERIIKRFAFLPTLLDDGNTVFLKVYYVKQFFGNGINRANLTIQYGIPTQFDEL